MTPADKFAAREARRQFALFASRPEASIDLAHAALLVAAEEEPRACDVERCRATLYEWGLEARGRVGRAGAGESVAALNEFVFGELGFEGNARDYYDPRNSLLHRVIERRTGIPITLAVVYMDVGRRAGLHVEGVGMPGHFIVRASEGDGGRAVLVDAFQGATIDEDDCEQRLEEMFGGQVALGEEHLRAATTREILVRVLRNLKGVYAQARLHREALRAVERIILLAPHAAEERRDRGTLLAQLGRFHEAVADLQAYLNLMPHAPDAEQARQHLKTAQTHLATLN